MKGNLAQIERSLPFGFANAELRRVQVDYQNATAAVEMGIVIAETTGEWERRAARIILSGVTIFAIEPPHPAEGQFEFRLLIDDWNSYLHIRASEADLVWLD